MYVYSQYVRTNSNAINNTAVSAASCNGDFRRGTNAKTRVANFVHPDSATKTPRAHADVTNQRPQIKNAAGIASLVFELDAYCVNGYAAQANARTPARSSPPNRYPTSASPSRQRTSNAI